MSGNFNLFLKITSKFLFCLIFSVLLSSCVAFKNNSNKILDPHAETNIITHPTIGSEKLKSESPKKIIDKKTRINFNSLHNTKSRSIPSNKTQPKTDEYLQYSPPNGTKSKTGTGEPFPQ